MMDVVVIIQTQPTLIIRVISSPMEVPMEIRLLHPNHPNHQQIQCMVGITAQPQQQLQFHNMKHPMIYHGLQIQERTQFTIPTARLLHLAHSQEVLQIIPSP